MEETHQKNNPLNIPVAIVVAGGLIAAAIFLRGGSPTTDADSTGRAAELPPPSVIALNTVDPSRDHIRGNPDADIVIVEFSDTECPFCKRFHTTMQQLLNEYGKGGKIAWVYRHYPIVQLHSKAPKEAEALECAAELGGNAKFWEYTDRIFAVTPSNDGLDLGQLPRIATDVGLFDTEFSACLSSGRTQANVQSDFEDGNRAGVQGTPHSIFVLKRPVTDSQKSKLASAMEPYGAALSLSDDGLRLGMSGALPLDAVKKTIDTLLK